MPPDFTTISFDIAKYLLVIILMIVSFLFILKRIKGGSLSVKRYPAIKNLATLSLAPKRSLALVEVCDEWLLVGVGTENISLISKIDKPADSAQYDEALQKSGNVFDSFLSKAGLKGKQSQKKSSDKNE